MTDPKERDADAPVGLMAEDGRLKREVVLDDREERSVVHREMVSKVGSAMAVIAVCVGATYALPALEWARPWTPDEPVPFWNVLGRPFEGEAAAEAQAQAQRADDIARDVLAEVEVEPKKTPPPAPTPPELIDPDDGRLDPGDPLPEYAPHPDDAKEVAQPLERAEGDKLERVFEGLALAELGVGGVVRAAHWGDSAIGVDGIPSAIRTRLQARFGDAGHGFHALSPPNTSYRHDGVFIEAKDWARCFIIRRCQKEDGRYGLAGVVVASNGGAMTRLGPDEEHAVSRFELWYAGMPKGGTIRYRVDEGDKQFIETAADALEDRWQEIELPEGQHSLEVRASGGGRVRLYGVVMERGGPGVVWDSLALVGAFTNRMLEFDPEHLRAQLQRRQTDLVVFTFGGNDMIRSMKMETYEDEYRRVLKLVRGARPEAACIVMSPLDHGLRKGSRIVSLDIVPKMVESQRKVAKEQGCAFFDTYLAMGGEGSAGRWHRGSPRLVSGDLSHLTRKGQAVIGEMFYRALMARYAEYRRSGPTISEGAKLREAPGGDGEAGGDEAPPASETARGEVPPRSETAGGGPTQPSETTGKGASPRPPDDAPAEESP